MNNNLCQSGRREVRHPGMKRLPSLIALIIVLFLSFGTCSWASDWKLADASLAEYANLNTPEKDAAAKWLSSLPDAQYKESFRQLVMGLVLWSYREPVIFLDYEFVKLFQAVGKVVDIYTFSAGDAKVALEIYQPPIIPGDL